MVKNIILNKEIFINISIVLFPKRSGQAILDVIVRLDFIDLTTRCLKVCTRILTGLNRHGLSQVSLKKD